jgi:hypothetical protein
VSTLDTKIIWEAVKEPLREIVMAAIPGVLAYLQTIPAEWAIVLYLVIRGIDSYLHNLGKENENETLITGLTRF